MEKSTGRQVLPVCMLLHELINDMSIIIGNVDLATEKMPANPDCAKRLQVIGETARHVVRGLQEHQCELTGLLRTTRMERKRSLLS